MKTCNTCGVEKEETEFSGRYAKCKVCRRSGERQRVGGGALAESWHEIAHEDYWREIPTTQEFVDAVEGLGWSQVRKDRAAFALAIMIDSCSWDRRLERYASCISYRKLDQIWEGYVLTRAITDLADLGLISMHEERYDVVIVKAKGKTKIKRAWPRDFILGEVGQEDIGEEEVYSSDSDKFDLNWLVNYWSVTGAEYDMNWRTNGHPYWQLTSESVLNETSVEHHQIDPLFHGIDWPRITAIAQNDIHRISMSDEAFEFDEEGYAIGLSDLIKDQLELKVQAVYNLREEAEKTGVSFEKLERKALEALYRGQFNAAVRVYEGRVVVLHRSNTRIHNKVSMLGPEIRSYLFNIETGDYLSPRDVNNAGIASAVYKVGHLADQYDDVQKFIQDAKDGTFYQNAYSWLQDAGLVEWENDYDEGGKAEVKYGTRVGRTDWDYVCSGVLPHLYHSGDVAYEWLAAQGCEVSKSKRRDKMHAWAYANYPHVYEVLDELKRQVAERWLVEEISTIKFRRRYIKHKKMAQAIECGSSDEEIARDWNETDGFERSGYRTYLASAAKVRAGLEAGKTLFEISMPSALAIREDKITSEVSRSIHDAETAGQWQGVLIYKEKYPDSVVVSIHDCVMCDVDADYLGDCLVEGWANCLCDPVTHEMFGMDVSVDNDEH